MSPITFSLWILTWVTMATVVQSACQSKATMTSINEWYNNINACAFPSEKLSKSCVNVSCPLLSASKVCPYKSDGSLDSESAVTQINKCFLSMTQVCGNQWDPINFPSNSLQLSLLGLAKYTCTLPPSGVRATGLNHTTLTSIGPNATAFTFSCPNVEAPGSALCVFSLLNLFTLPLPPITFTGTYKANYMGTADIDISQDPPIVNVTSADNDNTLIPQTFGLIPANILSAFTNVIKDMVMKSDDDVHFVRYVATYVAYALQLLKDNC